jgi:hypothetical protein
MDRQRGVCQHHVKRDPVTGFALGIMLIFKCQRRKCHLLVWSNVTYWWGQGF